MIRSQSDRDPKWIFTGSMQEIDSYASRGWKILCEVAATSEDGTFSLMDLLKQSTEIFGSNKRRGKVLLAIYEQEGWIVRYGKRGNDILYRLAGSAPPEPEPTPTPESETLERFMYSETDTKKEGSDFDESWKDVEESKVKTNKREPSRPEGDNSA